MNPPNSVQALGAVVPPPSLPRPNGRERPLCPSCELFDPQTLINQSKSIFFLKFFCSSFSSTTPFSCHIESRSMWKVESVAANSQPRQQKQKETPKRLESAWKGKKAFVSSFCAPLFSLNEHNAQSVDDCLCHLLANPSGRKVGFGPGRSTDQLEKAWFLAGTAPGRGRFDCSKPDLSSQLRPQREQSDSSRLRR